MTDHAQILTRDCPTNEISAYIDGELDIVRELEMDAHFAICPDCTIELNQQKQFLCGLNASLNREQDIELPSNFTRSIVANAESSVSGVRRPRELYNAVFICVALALFVLFALGADAGRMITGAYGMLEQTATVGGIFGQLIYSIFIGIVIVLRSFATQFGFDLVMMVGIPTFFGVSLVFISRKFLRIERT